VRCCWRSTREEAIDLGTETLDAIPVLLNMKAGVEVMRRGEVVVFCEVGDVVFVEPGDGLGKMLIVIQF